MPLLPQPKLSKIQRPETPSGRTGRSRQIDGGRVPNTSPGGRFGTRPLAIWLWKTCPQHRRNPEYTGPPNPCQRANGRKIRGFLSRRGPPCRKGPLDTRQTHYIGRSPACKPPETGSARSRAGGPAGDPADRSSLPRLPPRLPSARLGLPPPGCVARDTLAAGATRRVGGQGGEVPPPCPATTSG